MLKVIFVTIICWYHCKTLTNIYIMITLSFIWFHRSYIDPGAKPQGQKLGSFLPNWFSFCFSCICIYRTFLGASCSQGWPHIWVVPTDMCTKVMHNGKGTNPFKTNKKLHASFKVTFRSTVLKMAELLSGKNPAWSRVPRPHPPPLTELSMSDKLASIM